MSIFEDFRKNITEFTENAAKKSSEVIETQKLKMRKSSLESDLRDCYVALGRLYEKELAQCCNDDSDEGKLVNKIASIRKSMVDIDAQLRNIKGVVRCPKCGRNISDQYDFCPKCGAPVKTAQETDEEPVDEHVDNEIINNIEKEEQE